MHSVTVRRAPVDRAGHPLRFCMLYCLLIILVLALAAPVSALVWVTQTVDSGLNYGAGSSLKLDSAGNPHISYIMYPGDINGTWRLRYANKSGTIWTKMTVDPQASSGDLWEKATSLALDSSGNPMIAYYNETSMDLRYAVRGGSGWTLMVADPNLPYHGYHDRGKYPSIALDTSGNPHISYYHYNSGHQQLKYASWDGASWSNITAPYYMAPDDIHLGYSTSLAIDSSNTAHMSTFNITGDVLHYVTWNGVSWTDTVVDNTCRVGYTSLALDNAGNPRISYLDYDNYNLKYAWKDAGIWHNETVSSALRGGNYNSLAIDSMGNPHISYHNYTSGFLMYASKSGSSWTSETVDRSSADTGWSTSLVLDSSGNPHISYWDYLNGRLKYAVGTKNTVGSSGISVFRNGAWYLDTSGNGWWDGSGSDDLKYPAFGTTGDKPVAGDWNGDALTEIGVFRNGAWYLDINGNGWWDGPVTDIKYAAFGTTGDLPVAGNWSSDEKTEIGVFRNGAWYLDKNGNGWWDGPVTDIKYAAFGTAGDKPVAGDWNGDKISEIGVFRNGAWYLDYNGNGWWDGSVTDRKYPAFGTTGDLSVAGDWNGDKISEIGVFRNGAWYLDYNGNGWWDGPVADLKDPAFGTAGDLPVTGRWTMVV
jgi:hypothetical protein